MRNMCQRARASARRDTLNPENLMLQVAELLAAGADPAAPDARGRPAYALAPAGPDGQDARDAFRRARAAAGEGAADWAAAGVPEALTPELEAAQAAKAVRPARPMQGCGVVLAGCRWYLPTLGGRGCSSGVAGFCAAASLGHAARLRSPGALQCAGARKRWRRRAAFAPEAPC